MSFIMFLTDSTSTSECLKTKPKRKNEFWSIRNRVSWLVSWLIVPFIRKTNFFLIKIQSSSIWVQTKWILINAKWFKFYLRKRKRVRKRRNDTTNHMKNNTEKYWNYNSNAWSSTQYFHNLLNEFEFFFFVSPFI